VEESQFDRKHLIPEVTTNAILSHALLAEKLPGEIQLLGVGIELDDFSTGFSWLSYLQSFPCDKVKLDWSFLSRMFELHPTPALIRPVPGIGLPSWHQGKALT
jgi:predicted signal transduction protein with EAL and GGDEF domain